MRKLPRAIRAVITVAAAMVAMLALGIGAAAAQEYPPGEDFSVTCVAAGEAGASVTCTVVGAAPNEQLTVTAAAAGNVFFSEVLSASAEGEAIFRFTVPTQYRGQEIAVTVTGPISGTTTDEIVIEAPGRTGEALPRPLPRTGQDLMLLGAAGVLLLGGGIAALRRRSTTRTAHRSTTSV
jgi:LPXTG-motif cell wall-anchored protein